MSCPALWTTSPIINKFIYLSIYLSIDRSKQDEILLIGIIKANHLVKTVG